MPDWLLFIVTLPAIVCGSIGVAEVIYRAYCWMVINQEPERMASDVVPIRDSKPAMR